MPAEAFRDTLPPHERHFVGRFESFADIVVGFSMSLLALQLTVPHNASDVFGHPMRYVFFFASFALVSVFWIGFHRIVATGFAPQRIDMVLALAYLAFVALTPYAMLANLTLSTSSADAYAGLGLYVAVFGGVSACSLLLSVRGARRGWPYLDETRRRALWRRLVMNAMVLACLAVALSFAVQRNVAAAGASMFAIFPAMAIVRRFFTEPRPAWLGIADPAAGTSRPQAVS